MGARLAAISGMFMMWVVLLAGSATQAQEHVRLVPQLGPSERGGVNAVAISSDGRFVLTGNFDHTAQLWNVFSGLQLRSFPSSDDVEAVALSPDGRLAFIGGPESVGELWDVNSGQPIRSLGRHIVSAAFSADGRLLVTGGAFLSPQLWDVASGNMIRSFGKECSWSCPVAFSPDGRFVLAGGGDSTVKLWDAANGQQIRVFQSHSDNADRNTVYSVAFSADGRFVITGGSDNTARLWYTDTAEQIRVLRHDGLVISVAFSPDGRFLLTGGTDGKARLWDGVSGVQILSFGEHSGWVKAVAFSPDGGFMVMGTDHSAATMWDTASGQNTRIFTGAAKEIYNAAFSPDGHYLAIISDGDVSLFDTASNQCVSLFGQFRLLAFSPDGRLVLTDGAQNSAILWDAASGKQIRSFVGHNGYVSAGAFSPDGSLVLTGSGDKSAKLWNASTGQLIRSLDGHTRPVESVTFSSSGRYVLTGGLDNSARLWDTTNGTQIGSFGEIRPDPRADADGDIEFSKLIDFVAYSPNGQLVLTGGSANTDVLWDAATLQPMLSFEPSTDQRTIRSLAFSPDGRSVLTGMDDGSVRLWDIASGKQARSFEGHTFQVQTAVFSPDGRFVVATSADRTARLWDAASGKQLATLLSFGNAGWVVIDPAGRFDTSNLDGGAPLAWVVDSDSMRALSLEIFMRDYYTPRLLSRIMNHEKLPNLRSIAEIKNRIQPKVSIVKVIPSVAMTGRVDVVVHAANHTDESGMESGLQDLRVLRDGQMVANGYLEGALKDGDFTFKNIMLKRDTEKVVFTAYAFNIERIKSETASFEYLQKATVAKIKKPRAYLLQIGVNHSAAQGCELQYSDNDAEQLSAALSKALAAQGMVVEAVVLESPTDGDARGASKARIHAAIAAIAAKATPNDAFFLSFSGHGYATNEQYYMIPSDVTGSCLHVDKALLASTISADELAEWLRPLDAGDMVFVLDACHSAQSVEAGEFKPGPMGNRGLGQLAYDKRMRILVASQAREVAIEYDNLQQGLLSYVLTQDGLLNNKADWKPANGEITVGEWLSYAANAVPKFKMDEATTDGHKDMRVLGDAGAPTGRQVPAVFDFSKSDGFVLKRLPSAH